MDCSRAFTVNLNEPIIAIAEQISYVQTCFIGQYKIFSYPVMIYILQWTLFAAALNITQELKLC